MKASDDLNKQIARLLRRRPGWSLQAMPTPGARPVWCFGSRNHTDLSVTVDTNSIGVFVVRTDQEVTLGSASEFVAWLKTHRPEALTNPRSGVLDKLKGGNLFKWG